MARLKALLLAMIVDSTDVGETWSGYNWVKALARRMDVTLLCMQRPGRLPTAEQLPEVRVVTWPEPAWLGRFERVRGMAQPAWPLLTRQARRWIAEALARGERFDVAHQILPQAMRFSCPFRHFDMPYAVGPLGGSLDTPAAFAHEVPRNSLAERFRALDAFRFRYDPNLRASYARADAILGVAPYVRDVLKDVPIKRFETVLERSAEPIAHGRDRSTEPGRLKLLHVGRTIRTKALRDVIRALAQLRDLPGVTLTSAGEGEDLDACRREATELHVADRVTFLGRVPRERVEELYATHDVFAFPSFREPMGGVFFEAMRWGLPVLAARRGGPEAIFDDQSALFVEVTEPARFAADIAGAIRTLATDVPRRLALGEAAHRRLESFGSWDDKAAAMDRLYRELIAARQA